MSSTAMNDVLADANSSSSSNNNNNDNSTSGNNKKRRVDARDAIGWSSEPIIKDNDAFDAFYKAQHITKGDEDWKSFKAAILSSLPACFRFSPNVKFPDELTAQLHAFVGKNIVIDGIAIDAVKELSWYPNAYQLGIDKRAIKKLAGLSELHTWMMENTENGNITRQEAVSMVPPLALNVEPHHKCLDLCAAPGSKTSQMLEIIHRSLKYPSVEEGGLGQGVVVANDADTQRAHMLVHQCKRINSPLLLVTTHKGQSYPLLCKNGYFDRVLSDVPCSGDGTMRKNPDIWKKWSCSDSMNLHHLQLQIAMKGFQSLKDDGLMTYSTCSMNPIEDEAVVAEILRQSNGRMQLIDARQFIPSFKCRPGLSTWNVLSDSELRKNAFANKRKKNNDDATTTNTPTTTATTTDDDTANAAAATTTTTTTTTNTDDIIDEDLKKCIDMGFTYYKSYSNVPPHRTNKIKASFFPPTPAEVEWMNLQLCLRCLPNDEDTGGFFVATFRKVPKALPVQESVATITSNNDTATTTATSSSTVDKQMKPGKQYVVYNQVDEGAFNTLKDIMELSDAIDISSFYTRSDRMADSKSSDKKKGVDKYIHYLPQSICSVIAADKYESLKLVTAGVKVVECNVSNNIVDYRLLQEGIGQLIPHMSDRRKVIFHCIHDFQQLLLSSNASISAFKVGATLSQLHSLPVGCFVSVFIACGHTYYAVCGKKRNDSIVVHVNKTDLATLRQEVVILLKKEEQVVA